MRKFMTEEEARSIVTCLDDLFCFKGLKNNQKQTTKNMVFCKLLTMTRADADRTLRPVKLGQTSVLRWFIDADRISNRDVEYSNALSKLN